VERSRNVECAPDRTTHGVNSDLVPDKILRGEGLRKSFNITILEYVNPTHTSAWTGPLPA
jgi:hypothetical protein